MPSPSAGLVLGSGLICLGIALLDISLRRRRGAGALH